MEKSETKDDLQFDLCVLCERETPYLIKDHIDQRNYYIEGAGQLCEECFHRIYDND